MWQAPPQQHLAGQSPSYHIWMADPHVVSALREKRAKLAGCIAQFERQLNQRRADLTHIDGVLRLFAPESDPETIRPKRTYRRTHYFARNELSRLCREALRDGRILSTDEIVGCVIDAKGFDGADASLRAAIHDQALTTFERSGSAKPWNRSDCGVG